ncbi:MAG TPA: hypothetical protein VFG03_03625 [Telluria sp.]|nr:hypothetical protein [Telluria sp.]
MNTSIRTVLILAATLFISHTAMEMLGYENYRIFREWHIDASWKIKQSVVFLIVFSVSFSGLLQLWKRRKLQVGSRPGAGTHERLF